MKQISTFTTIGINFFKKTTSFEKKIETKTIKNLRVIVKIFKIEWRKQCWTYWLTNSTSQINWKSQEELTSKKKIKKKTFDGQSIEEEKKNQELKLRTKKTFDIEYMKRVLMLNL